MHVVMSDLLGFYSATELGLGHVVLEPLDIIRLFLGLASSCRFWDLLCQNFWTSVRLCVCALTVVHLCSVEFVVMMNVFSLLADSRSVSVHRVNMSLLVKFNKIEPPSVQDSEVEDDKEELLRLDDQAMPEHEDKSLEWFETTTFYSMLATWPDDIPLPQEHSNIRDTITSEQYNYVASHWPSGVPMLESF